MDARLEQNLNDTLSQYQRAVHDRANDTYHDLRTTMESSMNSASGRSRNRNRSRSPGASRSPVARSPAAPHSPHASGVWEQSRNVEQSDYTYGAAVDRLRDMLDKHDEIKHTGPKNVQFAPRAVSAQPGYMSVPLRGPAIPLGEIPTPEELLPAMQQQTAVMHRLEADNRFCREELHAMTIRMQEVVGENHILHDELKRNVVQDLLQNEVSIPGLSVSEAVRPTLTAANTTMELGERAMTKQDYGRWQKDLERINTLHTAKASRLEAQLGHTKDELEKVERVCDQLKSQIRMQQSLGDVDPHLAAMSSGLCVRCANSEAVLPMSGYATHTESIQTLKRERDEVVEQLTYLKTRYTELRSREDDLYQQVKGAVQMVEQAEMDKTQVYVQREQLREELVGMQQRMEQHVQRVTNSLQEERDLIRLETKAEHDDLEKKLKELSESYAEVQTRLERVSRDKVSLTAELDMARSQLGSTDIDYGKATDNMKMSMTQATIEKNAAFSELKKVKKEMMRSTKDLDEEKSCMKTELMSLRRRLAQAEKEMVESKEECIHLTDTVQHIEREAHLARLGKESIEKNRGDDIKNVTRRAEQREQELNIIIDQMEQQASRTQHELESMVDSQSTLILKLRDECRQLAGQLEDVTHKFKGESKKLKAKCGVSQTRMERLLKRQHEMEEQNTQHGMLQDKMRQRLRQLDGHAQSSSQQVIELLTRESKLLRDRQLLAREVEFLRSQFSQQDNGALEHLYTTQHNLIDDILLDVKSEGDKASPRDMPGAPVAPTQEQREQALLEDDDNLCGTSPHMSLDSQDP